MTRLFEVGADFVVSEVTSFLLGERICRRTFVRPTSVASKTKLRHPGTVRGANTDEHGTTNDRLMTPTTVRRRKNRAFVVKINRLLRF